MSRWYLFRVVFPVVCLGCVMSATQVVWAAEPQVVSVNKIWDRAPYNSFTDLIRFDNRWWCTFREGQAHEGDVGQVRLITSQDGDAWKSAALIAEKGIDLRDPKLSITPDGRLMLVMGGIVYDGTKYLTRSPRIAFSSDGRKWTPPRKVLAEDHWLWRVTWHKGRAYSVSKMGEGRNPRRGILYRSTDGIDWQWITEFILPNETWNASETTLRFLPNDELVALVRPYWIGTSQPPYKQWTWTRMKYSIGGPNFIRLPDGSLWAAGRRYLEGGKRITVLARMTTNSYEPVLTLPSGGDCSYPGLVWHDGLLWMSYYSSHAGKANIYLARIRINR